MSFTKPSACILGLAAFWVSHFVNAVSLAQQPTNTATSSDAAAKTKILNSPEWNQAYDGFQKWLASQAIFTPADVERMKSNLMAQVQTMPASELQGFLDDWQARLKVLNGKDFQEAQQWLGEFLSVVTDGFRRQTLKNLGISDIANMSSVELEDAIIRIRADQLSRQQSRAAFDQTRQQSVQRVQQNNAARQTRQELNSGAAQFGTNQSPYRPQKFNPPPPPRRQWFVDQNGQIGFILPF